MKLQTGSSCACGLTLHNLVYSIRSFAKYLAIGKSIWSPTRRSLAICDTLIACYLLVRRFLSLYLQMPQEFCYALYPTRVLTSHNIIQVVPIQFNYRVFPGRHKRMSMLQPLGRTGMPGSWVLISGPFTQASIDATPITLSIYMPLVYLPFLPVLIYISTALNTNTVKGVPVPPLFLYRIIRYLRALHSSCMSVCPKCRGRMIKAILACKACLLYVPDGYVCLFTHVRLSEAGWHNLHVLVLIVVTLRTTMPRAIIIPSFLRHLYM